MLGRKAKLTVQAEGLMKRFAILFAAMLCLTSGIAFAQAPEKYPSKPVKIIVPYAPGGATDIVARILAEQMGKRLGQSFYVENKPGAFGIVAIEDMVRSRADGYTLMIGNVSTNAITPIIYPEKFKIDYANDVVPITDTVDIPAFLLATTKDFKVDTVAGLIDYTKKIRAGCAMAPSVPAATRITTWRTSPNAPVISI
jgi:tripartite-type tricarboxylate transporter receptor subunit TctC